MEKGGLARDLTAALTTPATVPTPATPEPATQEPATQEGTCRPQGAPDAEAATPGPLAGAVLFCDEMRLGLHGQVRRVWAPIGEKVEQLFQIQLQALAANPARVRSLTAWPWLLEQIRRSS